MNWDDAEAREEGMRRWLRPFQEAAYAELDSLRWWVRQEYGLLPTDERYLALNDEDIRIEYWLHVLTARRMHAEKEGISTETLDDLLDGATVDDRMAKIDVELERKAQQKTLSPDDRETVLHWKADEDG